MIKTSKFRLLIYVFSLTLCFLLFKQSDLTHTYSSSYAYLDGHIVDFYDYNKVYFGRNDYLPLLYVLFAIWNIPLKILNLLPDIANHNWIITTPIEVIWSKLMLVTFFAGTVIVIQKILNLALINKVKFGLNPAVLFATSPFVIFGVFIFSQYDIVGTFFTMLAIYFYFNRHFLKFALFFSVAISFKYFAVIIYLPLVLLIEKRWLYILRYLFIGVLVTLIQVGCYWHSEVFSSSIFTHAISKGSEATNRGIAILVAMAYLGVCIYAYFTKCNFKDGWESWLKSATMVSACSYGLMFLLVRWHPQWIVVSAPFFSMLYLFIRNQRKFLILEVAGYISFIWICANDFYGDVGTIMLYDGIFGGYFPRVSMSVRDILIPQLVPLARIIFNLYMATPLFILFLENRVIIFSKLKFIPDRVKTFVDSVYPYQNSQTVLVDNQLVNTRFLLGVLFFPILVVCCLVFT